MNKKNTTTSVEDLFYAIFFFYFEIMVWNMGVVFQDLSHEKWVYNFQTCHVPISIAVVWIKKHNNQCLGSILCKNNFFLF